MNSVRNPWLPFSFLLLLSLHVGCQNPKTPPTSSQRLKVVATTGMVADLVRQIGGENIEVEQLLSSGVDPHLYKANTDDVRATHAVREWLVSGNRLITDI